MTAHPACCIDHPCDYCTMCLGGNCCASADQSSLISASINDLSALAQAIMTDAKRAVPALGPSGNAISGDQLLDLMRADADAELIGRLRIADETAVRSRNVQRQASAPLTPELTAAAQSTLSSSSEPQINEINNHGREEQHVDRIKHRPVG